MNGAVGFRPPPRPFENRTALDPLGAKGGDNDWYGYCVDDPVNRVDAWELWWDWEDAADPAMSVAQTALERALKVGRWASRSLGVFTAPLGDLLFPDSVNDVEQETKEYWDKRYPRTKPEDMRERQLGYALVPSVRRSGMNLPSPGALGAFVLLAAAICYAVSVERKIVRGEIPLVAYSFKQTWRFGGIAAAVSTSLSVLIYWWTNDSSFALSWFAILMALSCVGLLRGLLAEYQHKRRGGRNLDEIEK